MSQRISISDEAEVRVIRLSRPERRNVLDMVMTDELAEAFESAGAAAAVVLLGEGDHFCVGGDVGAMGAAADPGKFVGALATSFHRVVRVIRAVPVPIVIGMRGWAAGAGMSLVLLGDVVVAGESASMRPAYPGIGVTPDGGMSWTLPRLLGARLAQAVLLENRALPALTMQQLGIADHVVADAAVDAHALALGRAFADGPTQAYAGIKKLVREGAGRGLDEQLDAEAASISARAGSAEGQEGIHAFLERRQPDFRASRARADRAGK